MSASPRPQPRRAPLLGEHDGTPAWPQPRVTPPGSLHAPEAGTLPLDGVRVVDLTVVWAGPHVTQLLGEWGAEVIRPEPVNRIQPSSRARRDDPHEGAGPGLGAGRAVAGQLPGLRPERRPLEPQRQLQLARAQQALHGVRHHIAGRARGLPAADRATPTCWWRTTCRRRSRRRASPGTTCARSTRDLIMVQMPGYGLTGPYRNYRVFGTHAEGMVGYHHLRSYPDAGPEYAGNALDARRDRGRARRRRRAHGAAPTAKRSGEGQHIELPLAESFLPRDRRVHSRPLDERARQPIRRVTAIAGTPRITSTRVPGTTAGSRSMSPPRTSSPRSARCWDAPNWPRTSATRASRAAARTSRRLDSELAALTADRDAEVLFHELQAAGVCAAPTHTALQALNDPQLVERGFFPELTMAGVGTHRYPGSMFKMANTAEPDPPPAALAWRAQRADLPRPARLLARGLRRAGRSRVRGYALPGRGAGALTPVRASALACMYEA